MRRTALAKKLRECARPGCHRQHTRPDRYCCEGCKKQDGQDAGIKAVSDKRAKCKPKHEAWKKGVRENAKGLCLACTGIGSDCHHLIYSSNAGTRYLVVNGAYLCRPCHIRLHSDHDYEIYVWERLKETRPDDYTYLITLAPSKAVKLGLEAA